MGKASLLGAVALIFLTTGPVYCILFQLAVYNHKTVPLNESITGKQSMNTGMQMLISFGLFIVPTHSMARSPCCWDKHGPTLSY